MTWSQFTAALRDVAQRGHLREHPNAVIASMYELKMIQGSDADAGGLVLTGLGRSWYKRAVVDREHARMLEAYAGMFDRVFDGHRKGLN